MAKLALAVILAVFFTNKTSANEYEDADWILVSDEEGVEVYTAEIENSDIRGVKGIFTMPYNCAYVFSVIMDNKRALTWVDRLISSEIIDEKTRIPKRYTLQWTLLSHLLIESLSTTVSILLTMKTIRFSLRSSRLIEK